jgi:hypothetical protein
VRASAYAPFDDDAVCQVEWSPTVDEMADDANEATGQ